MTRAACTGGMGIGRREFWNSGSRAELTQVRTAVTLKVSVFTALLLSSSLSAGRTELSEVCVPWAAVS